ncbi:MAG: hypothetical protein CML52_02295, partial [Rhodobacteraceae bacterium]|nr:hypothetical protein [Paracoccaceae bacterium]
MLNSELEKAIEGAWGIREEINPSTKGEKREAIESTLSALDSGNIRVAEKTDKPNSLGNSPSIENITHTAIEKELDQQPKSPKRQKTIESSSIYPTRNPVEYPGPVEIKV